MGNRLGGFSQKTYTNIFGKNHPSKQQTNERTKETNMKVKNFAFFGIMASILAVSGAYAADGTIIASKGYVDAQVSPKETATNRVTATWANSTADHNSTTKYPSMATLNSAIPDTTGFLTSSDLSGYEQTANQIDADYSNVTGDDLTSTTKYPSMNTLTTAIPAVPVKDVKAGTSSVVNSQTGEAALAKVAGTGDYGDLTNKPDAFTGADGTTAGTKGFVPQPTATDNTKYLKGDGTWAALPTIPTNTNELTNGAGFITSADVPVKGVTVDGTSVVDSSTGIAEITSPKVKDIKVGTSSVVDSQTGEVSLAKVATTGDYDDLTNKPTIPAAQIQSDWDQTDNTKADYIKNKPTIPTVPVLGVQRNGADLTPDSTTKKVNVEVPVLGVQRNGADLTPDSTTKKVNVDVPVLGVSLNGTALTPDSTTKVVSITETKANWSETNSNSAAYIENKPTTVSSFTNDAGYITDAAISAVPKQAYAKKDDAYGNTLNSIDSATQAATCNESSPCVLTYFKGSDNRGYYKWANMDTAGDSAVKDTTPPTQTQG